jgi:hypothetical protein
MEQELNAWLAAHPHIEALPGRDLFIVARYLIPMDAALMQGCLEASGIPAVLADAHLMQADLLLAPALGGVRILVPAQFVQQAQSVMEAFKRGEFALDENSDVE